MSAQTSFTKTQSIALPLPGGNAPYNIASGQINNDVFPDIVVSTTIGDHVYWLLNDGTGSFTLQTTPIGILNNAGGVAIADLNNDGFNDVVSTSSDDGKIVWFANDGNGNFGTEQIINNALSGPGQVYIRTIDNNSTPDVAVSAYFGNEVVWFANDGNGNFGSKNIINNTIMGPGAFAMEDIDFDGDIDSVIGNALAFGTPNDCRIEVFYNDGNGNFTADTNVVSLNTKDYIFSIMAEDVDNDSSLDILVTDITGDASWFKRTQVALGTATYSETVISTSIANPACLDLRDLDNDNQKDFVLTSASSGSGNDIVWYKGDGIGGFGPEQIIDATQNQAYTITFADFENDGDLDTATIAYGDDAVNIFRNERITLTVPENTAPTVKLYPNPVINELYLNTQYTEPQSISIYDMLGRKVIVETISNGNPIRVSQLERGTYILVMNEQNIVQKFIKQ
ncbi:T9SS type A sorting domain-containing protein [Psychroserpens sp.]|uniref:T9SS type A sorting domain-containing protein n=1 Tax=Psychroserpens sp. TaxID=2020870 RepID=UPI001AFEB97E|nr:T9SS type A sorting domain-containing protein [Psychroserpens sp.]MBO6606589.1 T9SS type A sorting domain-containing protein [Psychroserpens sp.]MBO6632762.1 T9SS type A sorting domain-containing protein [Psychroserpens sp.]MBO6653293.1 T9SS type A sorting domain-containing protein [Psychroserpens sp.]MBO6680680.1 T9SS type A sorting domain-containing protein [Psychroserpens sp.]MBO6750362.1 T9SS type A sorting domain-containing protein [Psychroserpens sp.]